MAGPYDSVVTIGGQSFVDGLWRLLGPALEGITNPLPIALPGFSNAQMRVTQLVPVVPGNPPPTGALNVMATVELVAEALLHVTTSTDGVNIALGQQNLTLTNIAGAIDLPVQNGTLSNIVFAGGVPNLGTGTGAVQLPATTGTFSGGTGTGTIALPNNLAVPGIPLPAVIPVAVELTPSQPLILPATVTLTVNAPSSATRFGLMFSVNNVTLGPVGGVDPNLAVGVTQTLQAAVNQIVAQLGIPATLAQPPVDLNAVTALIAPVPNLVAAAFDDAISRLLAETGRLTFPPSGSGASCEAKILPTAADAQLVAATNGTYVLQVGFKRATSSDIPAFPAPPSGAIECNVLVGNSVVLELLCCLVERLPAFALPIAATTGTVDINGGTHTRCCNFTGVTANFGGVAIGGGPADGISVCIDGAAGRPKAFSILGRFTQGVPTGLPLVGTIATVTVRFFLPVAFDLDDATSIANLRLRAVPAVSATVAPNLTALLVLGILGGLIGVLIGTLGGGLVGAIVGAVFGILMPVAAVIVALLLIFACDAASFLLRNAGATVLSAASLLRSPVAIPPGLLDAFGRLSPVSVTVDDLVADGVLHTPTSPWALLPRIGPRRFVPTDVVRPPVRDPKAERPQRTRPKPPGADGSTTKRSSGPRSKRS